MKTQKITFVLGSKPAPHGLGIPEYPSWIGRPVTVTINASRTVRSYEGAMGLISPRQKRVEFAYLVSSYIDSCKIFNHLSGECAAYNALKSTPSVHQIDPYYMDNPTILIDGNEVHPGEKLSVLDLSQLGTHAFSVIQSFWQKTFFTMLPLWHRHG